MYDTLHGNASFHSLLACNERHVLTVDRVCNVIANIFVIKITVRCHECANDVLFDCVFEVFILITWCAVARMVSSIISVNFGFAFG